MGEEQHVVLERGKNRLHLLLDGAKRLEHASGVIFGALEGVLALGPLRVAELFELGLPVGEELVRLLFEGVDVAGEQPGITVAGLQVPLELARELAEVGGLRGCQLLEELVSGEEVLVGQRLGAVNVRHSLGKRRRRRAGRLGQADGQVRCRGLARETDEGRRDEGREGDPLLELPLHGIHPFGRWTPLGQAEPVSLGGHSC